MNNQKLLTEDERAYLASDIEHIVVELRHTALKLLKEQVRKTIVEERANAIAGERQRNEKIHEELKRRNKIALEGSQQALARMMEHDSQERQLHAALEMAQMQLVDADRRAVTAERREARARDELASVKAAYAAENFLTKKRKQ